MVSTIRVESVGDRPVVVKRASGPEGERLRREGERLERASHPGVVPLVQHGATDDGWELRTLHAGRPASACGPLTVPRVASLAAGIASTLADLHDVGIVHGRLDASHVLVGDHGRPVLCGFGDGEPPARPADDVAALGALLDRWLGTDDASEPIPDRRWWGRRGWDGWDRRALLLLADQAGADPPTCRPTARRLAAAIADAVPNGARLDARPAMTADGPAHLDPIERLRSTAPFEIPVAWAARKGLVAVVALAVLLAGAGAVLLAEQRSTGPSHLTAMPSDTTEAEALEVRTATRVASAGLEAGGRRYRVGQVGDQVLIDDWDCDGDATPALLRPGTGEVFVFPRWVEVGTLAVEPEAQIADAHALLSETAEGACPTLVVRTVAGEVVPVLETVR